MSDASVQEFPETIYCPQCRRDCAVRVCQTKHNTLLTEIQICCPQCRRRLHKMKLKDWYDRYVQGQPTPKVDTYY